ncbi:MAG: rpoZ [Candidatus Adlerbacteria bacterium]|nr:rpoZ [Candidatus Adlerbacteria bacterium]
MKDFEQQLAQHYGYLRRFAYNFVSTREEADDLVQDTFVAALESQSFRGESLLQTWLSAILKFKALSYLRQKSRRQKTVVDGLEYESATETVPIHARQFDSMALKEVLNKIKDLPPLQSEAIIHTRVFGFPGIEFADMIGIPRDTVKTRVHYGMKNLHKEESISS